jgi:tyrosyl-tRNA synthetase
MAQNTSEISVDIVNEVNRQYALLSFGVEEITPEEDFKKMLSDSLIKKKPLRVKCGIDPTNVDVHLGHAVPYRKMRQFQDLGHVGVVIIGDYTAQIGDPSGKNESRPTLSPAIVKKNAEKYIEQVMTILDPQKTEIRWQSEWFKDKNLVDFLSWAGATTVAKLLSHETFRQRLEAGHSLGLHELFYPVLQGMDSVFISADVELGGTDQKFNVLMGRDYQKIKGLRPQVAMTLPIVRGLDGHQKMSKSLNNYIGILDLPFDKFGKVMSIPDELMLEYFKYLTGLSPAEFEQIQIRLNSGQWHPNEAKKCLAVLVTSFFHGQKIGEEMKQQFEQVFKKGQVPEDSPEYQLKLNETLLQVLAQAKMIESNSEIKRLLAQNAIGIVDGEKLTQADLILDQSYKGKVIKVGKRKFLKLV